MSEKPDGLQMSLPATAENVAVVRHTLAGLAEEIGMDEMALADLKTVVTEACMNVVVHAYEGEPGPLHVEAESDAEGLMVVIRDSGIGIRPQADPERPSLRLGLSLIAALSGSFAISGGLDRGTEIRMHLPLRGSSRVDGGPERGAPPRPERTDIAISRSEMLGPVLSRVIGALAARKDFSIDRVSDAVLLSDAIAAAAPSRFADGLIRLAIDERDADLSLSLGPMEDGGAERVREALAVPGVGGSLEALADELAVRPSSDGDYLVIRFAGA